MQLVVAVVKLVILDYTIFDCFPSRMPDSSLSGRRITLRQHSEKEKHKDLERVRSIMIY